MYVICYMTVPASRSTVCNRGVKVCTDIFLYYNKSSYLLSTYSVLGLGYTLSHTGSCLILTMGLPFYSLLCKVIQGQCPMNDTDGPFGKLDQGSFVEEGAA